MFLIVKKGTSILCLHAAEAALATVYASIKEEYKNLELELVFKKPEMEVFYNIVSFIREIDRIVGYTSEANEEDSEIASVELDLGNTKVEEISEELEIIETSVAQEVEEPLDIEESIEEIELSTDTEELIFSDDEIEEPIDFEEREEVVVVTQESVIPQENITVEEPAAEIVKEEIQEIVIPKVPNTPGDRMMESLKEQQKNEGLLELEDDKVNTLAYKEHLINYMKLGFATSLLKKKVRDCNDTAEQSRLYNFCENIEKRTDEYELRFKEIGLTTGQVHTFRMEVLRDIRKYQDDSIKEICDYINKLYGLSENLISNLK